MATTGLRRASRRRRAPRDGAGDTSLDLWRSGARGSGRHTPRAVRCKRRLHGAWHARGLPRGRPGRGGRANGVLRRRPAAGAKVQVQAR